MYKYTVMVFLVMCSLFANSQILQTNTSPTNVYNYYYNDNRLQDALSLFAKSTSLNIYISSDIDHKALYKTVNGRFSANSKEQFLDLLTHQYGLEWFIYSGTLYIASKHRVVKNIDISSDSMVAIKSNLEQLGLLDPKFGYTEFAGENRISVSGPSVYVNMVHDQIASLNIAPKPRQFAVYRLKYANATDVVLSFNNQQVLIPGVVTVLQSLLRDRGVRTSSPMLNQVVEPIKNQANQILNGKEDDANNASSENADKSSLNGFTQSNPNEPSIQADSRTNSVLIRDKQSNLQVYRNLIDLLDIPTPLVQVEVLIVRLDQQNLDQAGINWWASNDNTGIGYGVGNLGSKGSNNDLSLYYGRVNPGQSIVTNFNSFVTSLQLLEQNKLAKTIGKPTLATVDNIPAIVNVDENLYLGTPIQSSKDSNNGNNFARIMQGLQITPHVVYGNNKNKIKLSIVLQDGAVDTQGNIGVPSTIQSSITSQAVISEGQSLLIAGYTKDTIVDAVNKVPLLGDIPLLGWFFKSSTKSLHKTVTLYLVTPKVMWQNDLPEINDFIVVDDNKLNLKQQIKFK